MEFIDLQIQKNILKRELMLSIEKVIDDGKFILGPEVAELEKLLAAFTNTKHCITNANGTDALVLALRALDIKAGDEVLVPAFTFFATAEAVSLVGATPIFVDIDENTYNIDVKILKKHISSKTKAAIAVGLYGLCPDLLELSKLCKLHNISLIEDAAQSFGASTHDFKSCSLATVSCTSFFPSKPLGCYGDGGACFTNDDIVAKKITELRTHGQEKRYYHTDIGYNSRLDTIQAAILINKMKIFPNEIIARQAIAKRYQDSFLNKLKFQTIPEKYNSVFAQFTIEVSNREELQELLKLDGIPTAVHYPIPLHKQPTYQDKNSNLKLPTAEKISQRVVSLPMHPYLNEENQNHIIEKVLKYAKS